MRSLTISRWPCHEATCSAVRPSLSGMLTLIFDRSKRYLTILTLFSSAKMYKVVRLSASFRLTSQPYFSSVLTHSMLPGFLEEIRFKIEFQGIEYKMTNLRCKRVEMKFCHREHANQRIHCEWSAKRQ